MAALETFGNLGQEVLAEDAKAVLEHIVELTKDSLKDVREGAENALKKLMIRSHSHGKRSWSRGLALVLELPGLEILDGEHGEEDA